MHELVDGPSVPWPEPPPLSLNVEQKGFLLLASLRVTCERPDSTSKGVAHERVNQ
jgi:hypothetical protein